MDDIFLSGTEAVIANLLNGYNKFDIDEYCTSVLKLSGSIYGFDVVGKDRLDFKTLADEYIEVVKSLPMNVDRYDVFKVGLNLIADFLTKNTTIQWPQCNFIVTDKFKGWSNVDAPLIWEWIHILTIHLDINAGINEKVSFIHFIKSIVLCGFCNEHYKQNIPHMVDGLYHLSLTDTFLLLHSCIANETEYSHMKKHLIRDDQKYKFNKSFTTITNNKYSKITS